MNQVQEIILSGDDFKRFRSFLDLDEASITWQEKNRKDFEDFWSIVFISGLSLSQVSERLKYLLGRKRVGPLLSWFKWLQEGFYFYIYTSRDISIEELSKKTSEDISQISRVLRNSLCNYHPDLENRINKCFLISHNTSEKGHSTFTDIVNHLKISKIENIFHDGLKERMELTLYSDWIEINKSIKKDFLSKDFNFKLLKEKTSLRQQLKIARDTLILIVLGIVVILGVKLGNEMYEKYIIDKISVLESQLNWKNQSLSFQRKNQVNTEIIQKTNPVDISNFGEDPFKEASIKSSSDFNTESNVSLTSWGELPRDLDSADERLSDYEEISSSGYRDVRYGRTKVFRVLIRSSFMSSSNRKIKVLLNDYKAEQVDNVKPGKKVPGGNYYNVFLPSQSLKEFLSQVTQIDDAILYESNTRANKNPPGMNKVFIWVKSI